MIQINAELKVIGEYLKKINTELVKINTREDAKLEPTAEEPIP